MLAPLLVLLPGSRLSCSAGSKPLFPAATQLQCCSGRTVAPQRHPAQDLVSGEGFEKRIGHQRNPKSLGLGDVFLSFMSRNSVSNQNRNREPLRIVLSTPIPCHEIILMHFQCQNLGKLKKKTSLRSGQVPHVLWVSTTTFCWSNPPRTGLHPRHRERWVHHFPVSRSFR